MNAPIPPPVWLAPDPDNPSVLRPSDTPAPPDAHLVRGGHGTAPHHHGRAPLARPTLAFMLSHPAHAIALGFGSGLAPRAPGTVGTLWGWAAFVVLQPWLNDVQWAVFIGLNLLLGWWASTVTARHMGQPDSSHMVWDEVVAIWLVMWLLAPASLWTQAWAFALFRLFDAVKFGPMAWADQAFKGFGPRGGFGVMLDDLAAAFCTLLVFAWWRF
ncbi:MAG: phosphatidylglycerophosphatase A [Polaromonas sp.]|nr:phosphatidylglycerophosphatase A [Polaromonas sp.]